jgi:ketosteroid isomerase-like protein
MEAGMGEAQTSSATVVIDRLLEATNRHDLDGIAGCFAAEFVNETPLHPARSFQGREQVRRNWEQILTGVPDLRAAIVARAADDDTVWTEWEMDGTRRDGARRLMRGVMVFKVTDDAISRVRFYLEPVDESSLGIDAAIRQTVSS